MLQFILSKQLERQEKSLGVSLDYVRHIVDTSLSSFVKFGLFMPLAQHRNKLPVDAYAVARIIAARDEDCGTCVQLEVNQAIDAGVSTAILQAVLDDLPEHLAPPLASVYHFTRAVVEQTGTESVTRGEICQQWGEEALVELSLAIGASRLFPVVKRSLGYATSCAAAQVQVTSAETEGSYESTLSNKRSISSSAT